MSLKGILLAVLVFSAVVGGAFIGGVFEPSTRTDVSDQSDMPVMLAAQPEADSVLVEMAESYTPNAEFSDDYRCFLFDPQLEQDIEVTGFRVNADQENLVHHVVVFVATSAIIPQAMAEDRGAEGPGWTCFGGPIRGSSGDISNALGTWAPGVDNMFPEGTSKRLRAGTQLVVQIHYSLVGTGEIMPDSSSLELFTSTQENLSPLLGFTVTSPVEIKCPGEYPEDPADPCHREYALKNVLDPTTNGAFHANCRTNHGFYLARDVGDGSSQEVSCDVRVPRSAMVLGAWGHMHLRGATLRLELNPDTENDQLMLYIPRWNFNNQEMYWFDQPIHMNGGDTIRITCSYDNSEAIPAPDGSLYEPRYIIWGEGTTDEMCLGLLQWVRP